MNAVEFYESNREKLISLFGFAMVFALGFFSGYYYLLEQVDKRGVEIIEPSSDCKDLFDSSSASSAARNLENAGKSDNTLALAENKVKSFVASKNSTLYHRSDCAFAAKIKEENRTWFSSTEEAESKGLKPHSCIKEN